MTNQTKFSLVTGNGFVVEAIVKSVKSIIVWS
jgi:hypothetical protein